FRDEAGAVGGAVEGFVVHQHDLAIGGELAVDLRRRAAVLTRRTERGERILGGTDRVAAMAADMDEAVLAGEQPVHSGPPFQSLPMPAARALSLRKERSARKKIITVGASTMKVTTAALGKIMTL